MCILPKNLFCVLLLGTVAHAVSDPIRDSNYLIITHPDLTENTTWLDDFVDFQEDRGFQVGVYSDLEDGTTSNSDIRNFILEAHTTGVCLQYILLAGQPGNGNIVNGSAQNFIPFGRLTFTQVPYLDTTDILTDDYYIKSGNGNWFDDLQIGRVPAITKGEMEIFTQKLIANFSSLSEAESWRDKILFLSQDYDCLEKKCYGDRLEPMYTDVISAIAPDVAANITIKTASSTLGVENYQCGSKAQTLEDSFISDLNSGYSFINYMGTSADPSNIGGFLWSQQHTNASNFSTITNSGKLANFIGVSCNLGVTYGPSADSSVIRDLLFHNNGGIISAFAPTTLTDQWGCQQITKDIMKLILNHGYDISGEVYKKAKQKLAARLPSRDWLGTAFVYYGDPSMPFTNYHAGGIIEGENTWSGTVVIKNDVTVAAGASLTIAPGTIIQFSSSSTGSTQFNVDGNLFASGTPENPIIFTSSNPEPARGDWDGIHITNTSGLDEIILDNIIVEYSYYGIYADGVSPSISNSLFQNNEFGIFSSNSTPEITSNQFIDNGTGIISYNSSGTYSDNRISNNTGNGIYYYGTSVPYLDNNSIDNNGGMGIRVESNVDIQFMDVENNDFGFNEIEGNSSSGIVANYYSDVFLGTINPYGDQVAGSNSIYANGTSNVIATNHSHIEALLNWWNSEEAFDIDGTSSIDYLPMLSASPLASTISSISKKGIPSQANPESDDCLDYDFFSPDINSQCELWRWAQDLRITNQGPEALQAWRLYVEKFPSTENAPKALVKIVNFSSEEDRDETISYLKQVMQKNARYKTLKNKALELMVSEQTKAGVYPGAVGQARKLLAQAQNDEQERIALLSLIDLHMSYEKNSNSLEKYLDMLKSSFPNDELTELMDKIVSEALYQQELVRPTLPEEEEKIALPEEFALYHAYPNPFNPITHIRYDLPEEVQVNLVIYDVTGRMVTTLVAGQQTAGKYEVQWNGRSGSGKVLSSGLYIYRLQTDQFNASEKILLLK